ncbi:MAG: type III pantothenate kinase [Betaproteobacteria bacterium]
MSWLVIDAGNTAIKWVRSDAAGRHFAGSGVQATGAGGDVAAQLIAAWAQPVPTVAFGVCVADERIRAAIEAAVASVAALPVQWFGSAAAFVGRGPAAGVELFNGYRDPAQLGADRWHALIAACTQFRGEPLLVVGAGTATTVDSLVTEAGAVRFIGGLIAPGYALMRASLAQGTARLPLAQGRPVRFADNTDDAIATGVHCAQLGLIEHQARKMAEELKLRGLPPARLVLTGGARQLLRGPLARSLRGDGTVREVSAEDSLVLRGVALRAHAEQTQGGAA